VGVGAARAKVLERRRRRSSFHAYLFLAPWFPETTLELSWAFIV